VACASSNDEAANINARGDGTTQEAPPATVPIDPGAAAERLRTALKTMPILSTADFSPAQPERMLYADLLVVGEIVAVEPGPARVFNTTLLECESEEGVRTGELCPAESKAQTLIFRIAPTSMWDTRSKGGVPVPEGMSFEISVGTPNSERSVEAINASIQQIVDATPIGSEAAMYLHRSTVLPILQLAHPSGWALMDSSGRLFSLALDRGGLPGIGGIEKVEQLPK
jgi:hypothetical protein